MLQELGNPDQNGVYTCISTEGDSLYIRVVQSDRQRSGFEWSLEKLMWRPTCEVTGLCEEHQVMAEHSLSIVVYCAVQFPPHILYITRPPQVTCPACGIVTCP